MIFGTGVRWMMPETLREYFTTPEEWERYCRQYECWMARIEGGEDPHVIKKQTTRTRCKGCGKFMSLFNTHIDAIGGHWHMEPYCLEKLMSLLEDNRGFDFTRKAFS
jgi:hypothetical protein